MLFNSLPFAIFFVALTILILSTPRRAEFGLLLSASLLFYAMWHPIYLILLGVEIAVNYQLLRMILKRGGSRPLMLTSVAFTIGILGWFKYSALTLETLEPILNGLLGLSIESPDIFLPLGISFYSFQIVAMNIDANRGQIKDLPSFPRYVLFISFFPQFIAGPIVRAHELLPQIEAGGVRSPERTRRGIWLIAIGAFKKIVMGDFFLAGFVAEVFSEPGVGSSGAHLIGMYAFAFQIYFDFSGYTNMARGLACLLGYDLPANFREPYLAVNPNDFWRRWHITLTTWFRDYIFLPLSLRSVLRTHLYACLMITWTLVGLWHGADWHYVLWGVYHALLLSLHRLCRPILARIRPKSVVPRKVWWFTRWAVTFNLIAFGLLLFRAESTGDAWVYLKHLFTGDYQSGLPPTETILIVVSLALHMIEGWMRRNQSPLRELLGRHWWGNLAEGAGLGAIAALVLAAMGSGGEFIYFQF